MLILVDRFFNNFFMYIVIVLNCIWLWMSDFIYLEGIVKDVDVKNIWLVLIIILWIEL